MVLSAGGHCVIARDSSPVNLASLIERHRITLTILVPTIVKTLVESAAARELDLTSLRTLIYTAAPISPTLLRQARDRFPSVRCVQVYGSTECLGATVLRPEEHEDHAATAGRSLPGVTLRIVDVLTGEPVADGHPGEICVRSPTIMSGYWNRPVETARAITSDGFVRTGDIGVLRDGFLTLVDRAKDMIISGGENIYPVEVEKVLTSHPTVAEAAVIGVPSPKWGETVLAFVVPAAGAHVDEAALIAFTRARLASYKCPTSVQTAASLPRNASGKVLKTVLREPFWQGHARFVG
jgi:long-chain acyl-CoA synthetase